MHGTEGAASVLSGIIENNVINVTYMKSECQNIMYDV